MLVVREIDALPEELPLLPWAEVEMKRTPPVERKIFVRRSEHVWVLLDEDYHTLAVAGVIRHSLTSIPELWILLCRDFRLNLNRNLRALKENMVEVLWVDYDHLRVKVDAEAPAGTRLAELFGFTEFGREEAGGREYIHLEVRK